MKITKFEQKDFDILEKFKSKVWPVADKEHYGDNQPKFFKDQFILVAKTEEFFVEYINVLVDVDVALIETLIVDNQMIGEGIGSALIIAAQERVKDLGVHKVWLETGKDWKAKEFYLKHGYVIRTELPNHIGGQTFLLMDKMI
jgi:GNAT superfamily N-acetyltransferase